jgi:hypothetical protein
VLRAGLVDLPDGVSTQELNKRGAERPRGADESPLLHHARP